MGGEKNCFGAEPVGVGVLVVHCLHSISWTNWWSSTKLAQTHYLERGKKWLDFGDTDLIFKVIPALWNIQILTKKLVCTLSLEANDGFWPKFIYIATLVWIKDLIAFSRSPHYKNCKIFKFWPNKACLHPISWTKWRILAKLHIL